MNPVAAISLRPLHRLSRIGLATAAVFLLSGALPAAAAAQPGGAFAPPLPAPLTVLEGFAPPAHPWLAGSRGVALAANSGEPVFAATAGAVVYAGELAGRGVISIGDGRLRVTYEPVTPVVSAGERVDRGQLIGHVSGEADSCGLPGSCLHWGVRDSATYLDPMALLMRRPPVRLLPIWADRLPPAIARAPRPLAPVAVSPSPATATAKRPTVPAPHRTSDRPALVVGGAALLSGGAVLGTARFRRTLRPSSQPRASRSRARAGRHRYI